MRLQQLQLLAHRTVGNVQSLRGRREAAVFGGKKEKLQRLERQPFNLFQNLTFILKIYRFSDGLS